MLPIAQVPSAMYVPIVVLGLALVVLTILAGRARSHDDRQRAERLSNWSFLIVLVFAAWSVVILIASVVGYPSRFYDMVVIILVIIGFFALLLFAFFLIAELVPRALRRGGDR
jgi:hypothetical protein